MISHAPQNYLCPFCLIVQGVENEHVYTVQTDVVYRDTWVTAVISSHQWPNAPGNTLIIPNAHYENLYTLPETFAIPIHRATQKIALAMKTAFACEGISTRQHNEPAGNQDVWHYHLHITPRFAGDDLYATLTTRRQPMPVFERANLARALRHMLEP